MLQKPLALPQFKLQRERRFSHVSFVFLSSASNEDLGSFSASSGVYCGESHSKESTWVMKETWV